MAGRGVQGRTAGTPILARWRGTVSPLTRCRPGPIPPNAAFPHGSTASQTPLQAFVERQPVPRRASGTRPFDGVRLGIETGRHFLRLLAQQPTSRDYADAFRLSYALLSSEAVTDPATAAYAGLMAGRALDGRRLRAALGTAAVRRWTAAVDAADLSGSGMPAGLGALDRCAVQRTRRARGAWQPDRLGTPSPWLRMGGSPSDERTLTAAQYADGTWTGTASTSTAGQRRYHTEGDRCTRRVVVPAR